MATVFYAIRQIRTTNGLSIQQGLIEFCPPDEIWMKLSNAVFNIPETGETHLQEII